MLSTVRMESEKGCLFVELQIEIIKLSCMRVYLEQSYLENDVASRVLPGKKKNCAFFYQNRKLIAQSNI